MNKLKLRIMIKHKLPMNINISSMTMFSFQDWVIFSGRANLVLVKYNAKMMRITKVLNFTRENISRVDPPSREAAQARTQNFEPEEDDEDEEVEEDEEGEDDQGGQGFNQNNGLPVGFQAQHFFFNGMRFVVPQGFRMRDQDESPSLYFRKFGYCEELDALVFPLSTQEVLKI